MLFGSEIAIDLFSNLHADFDFDFEKRVMSMIKRNAILKCGLLRHGPRTLPVVAFHPFP